MAERGAERCSSYPLFVWGATAVEHTPKKTALGLQRDAIQCAPLRPNLNTNDKNIPISNTNVGALHWLTVQSPPYPLASFSVEEFRCSPHESVGKGAKYMLII